MKRSCFDSRICYVEMRAKVGESISNHLDCLWIIYVRHSRLTQPGLSAPGFHPQVCTSVGFKRVAAWALIKVSAIVSASVLTKLLFSCEISQRTHPLPPGSCILSSSARSAFISLTHSSVLFTYPSLLPEMHNGRIHATSSPVKNDHRVDSGSRIEEARYIFRQSSKLLLAEKREGLICAILLFFFFFFFNNKFVFNRQIKCTYSRQNIFVRKKNRNDTKVI